MENMRLVEVEALKDTTRLKKGEKLKGYILKISSDIDGDYLVIEEQKTSELVFLSAELYRFIMLK